MERLAGRVILLWGWRRWLVATVAGAVASLALAPFDFPAAGFVAFPVLVWLLDGAVAARGRWASLLSFFTVGWFFGFGYFLAGMGWVGTPFARAESVVPFLFNTMGLPAALALFYGVAALLSRLLWSDGLGRIAALAFAFAVAEWLRVTLLAGFAWNAIGYVITPLPIFMQVVQVVGLMGLNAAAVFVFAAPALIGTRRHLAAGLALAAALVAMQLGYGYFQIASPTAGEFVQVRLVKLANAEATDFQKAFASYRELTAAPAAGEIPALVLWPENAVPFVLTERGDLLTALGETVAAGQVLVLGTKRREYAGDEAVHDAVAVITNDGEIADAADRQDLFLLANDTPFVGIARVPDLRTIMSAALGSSERPRRLLKIDEEIRALPLIGTEAIIPGAAGNEVEADVILNPADYSVFVGTPAPYQHLRQAQIQAVEAGRSLVLAMPSGIVAAIDSRGRILAAMGPGSRGTLDISLPVTKENVVTLGIRFYAGLTFAVFFGILALLISMRDRLM
ncbi:apolipoprotein N-acyltransferase [Chelativorans sp. YIM 93263]|uniref:apolipoprotein N-acyltransferase n=1 Tax=Chelativorans sp. YIM 93263 TaxID=2906648 RepID=UPI0023781D59|nr:apolipoprotein N-acyltransferase [Chelativorans sp. YIM 93263]